MLPLIALIIVLILIILGVGGVLFAFPGQTYNEKFGGDAAQDKALRDYKHLKPKKHLPTFEEFCYPKEFSVQPQQKFAAEYMAPGQNHKEMLIFHKIGAGKTCLSIQIAEKWKKRGKPIIIMPASLIPGFRNELRSPCGSTSNSPDAYITDNERAELAKIKPGSAEYKTIIANSDARIDSTYQIYSYNKFMMDMNAAMSESGVFRKSDMPEAPLIIIDEVQNITGQGSFYSAIYEWIKAHPEASVVIMSGTPIFDSPKEIYGLAKLLRIGSDTEDLIITPENIKKLFSGKVSYYAGAPDFTFPTTEVKIKKCKMSALQRRWYISQVEAEMSRYGGIKLREITNDFYIKSRQRSNIVYPNGLTGQAGLDALTPTLIRNSLSTYSCKFASLIKKLKRNQLSFVYTGFTGFGGITALVKCLKEFGWKDFTEAGPGRHRFVIWSGDQTNKEKDLIRATFNSADNNDASQIQVVIGSPSIKEGVTLSRVRQVHVMESYWNLQRLEQVYGRAVRYCSHKTLPKNERTVTIYIYCSITEEKINKKDVTPTQSIDMYMLSIANKKSEEAAPYIKALLEIAVDRYIYYGKSS